MTQERQRRLSGFAVVFLTLALLATAVLWVSPSARPEGVVTEYPVGDADDRPEGIAFGPDGNLWVAQREGGRIDRVTPEGDVTRFELPKRSDPARIVAGPDGALWFTLPDRNRIGRITVDGEIQEFRVPTKHSRPTGITRQGDDLWFTETKAGKVARIDLGPGDRSATESTLPITEIDVGKFSKPGEVAAGPDGQVWFTASGPNRIGRIVDGEVEFIPVPPPESQVAGIAPGPDGRIWFAHRPIDELGAISPDNPNDVTSYSVRTGSGHVGPTMLTAGPDGAVWVTATAANAVLRVSADGSTVQSFPVPSGKAEPFAITVGPGKDLWFTERATGKIGRISPSHKSPSVLDLTLTAQPASEAAGHQRTLAADLPADALTDTAVLQSSPLRATPLRATPLRATPLRATPLRATPLRATDLQTIQLSAIPLRATTWPEVLAGTVYADVPLQTVTLGDVFALDPPPAAVEALTLADVDLADTPLRATSLAALMLSGVPLDGLPEPAGGWCDFLAGQPLDCDNGADPASTTLLDLELAGNDLSEYLAGQVDLLQVELAGTDAPVAATYLVDIDLSRTPLGELPTTEVASLVTCSPTSCPTLADAQAAGELEPDVTVADLLELLPAGGVDRLGLGDLLAGVIEGTEVAYEDGPLRTILDLAEIREHDLVEYAADLTVRCVDVVGLEVAVALPPGFRMSPGSAELHTGGSAVPLPDPETDDETLRFRLPVGTGGVCGEARYGGTATAQLTLDVEPGATLATYRASASASTLLDRSADLDVSTEATAPVTADDSHDPGDTEETAQPVEPDVLYAGHLAHAADVDLYRLPAPAAGSTLSVSLSHLPADYDLVVYGPSAEVPSTPLRATPLRATPLRATPVGDGSDQAGTGDDDLAPNGLQDVPLRATPLRATSIRRGTGTESVTIPVYGSDAGGTFWIQVSGYNDAHNPEPYVLHTSVQPGPAELPCRPRDVAGTGAPGEFPQLPLPADTKTLVLVDAQRMGDLYGAAEAEAMLDKLTAYADHPDVAGVVVPVESDPESDVPGAMAAWDSDPCSVAAANAVVGEINKVVDHVRTGLTELRSVVLVGPDDALPMARVPDLTTVANERDYPDASIGGRDTSVSRALRSGFVLSDDPYGDFDPQAWLSGKLYVPDVALGRLVETPAEVSTQLDAYLAADGVLAPDSADVLGYDFLVDGSEAVGAALADQVPTTTRTDDSWTAADALGAINRAQPGYRSVNAHYDHYRALPAQSFSDGASADLLTSGDASPAASALLFTMGCHAGLNLPDIAVASPAPGEAEALLDWAQAAAGNAALFTGNTGFGYGDTDVVAYSERLMEHYADGLGSGEVTAGQALLFAKQRYAADLGVVGVYDAKVSQQTVFYGLPTYRIGADGSEGESVVPDPPEPPGEESSDETLRTAPFSADPSLERVDTERGSYWTVTGEQPQVTHFRPISPRMTVDVTAEDGLPVHGVVIEAQTSTDVAGVDPVYSQPTIDQSAAEPERQASSVAFPAQVQTVQTTTAPDGRRDTLVLMPGQTFTEESGGAATQRVFSHVSGTVYRSDSTDWVPPTIGSVQGLVVDGHAVLSARTADDDVMRGVVLYRDDTSTTWHAAELQDLGGGHWSVGVALGDGATTVTEFDVQLVDQAGNVGVSTNKGRHYVGEPATSSGEELTIVVSPDPPGESGFYRTSPQIDLSGLDEGESATVSVDGGPAFRYDGEPFTVSGDGVHVVRATADSGATAVSYVGIDTTPPVVTSALSPPANESGWRNEPVTVSFTCTDAVSGVASCPDQTVLDDEGPDQVVSGTASDRAGNSAESTVDGIDIDFTPPTVTLDPPILGFLLVGGSATGSADDNVSGIEAVGVTYEPILLGERLSAEATLTCDDARRSCTWSAPTPTSGLYSVAVDVTDVAGNAGPPVRQTLLVLDPG